MAFLDNSGDIILDAVLTDTGRMRLAKGDGSFKIAKFAFGDDEIVYSNYNKNHSSGSAYYDLEILQTPVLEAFTNNTSLMKSKLISISRTNILYLPVIKLNQLEADTGMHTDETFYVTVDEDTEKLSTSTGVFIQATGIMKGFQPTKGGASIQLDQGLDNDYATSPLAGLESDLLERQYIVEVDNRLASIVSAAGNKAATMSFLDDDNIASYYLSLGTDTDFVTNNTNTKTDDGTQTIEGPRGTTLTLKLLASANLQQSDYLFEQLGSTRTLNGKTVHYLDTTVRVTGATTGYRVDVPVRFVKL
jgi:hypothetical protein